MMTSRHWAADFNPETINLAAHFATVGGRILRGRAFLDSDRGGAPPVIIVEQALGEKLWPDQDPVGKCLILGRQGDPCREVVGAILGIVLGLATAAAVGQFVQPLLFETSARDRLVYAAAAAALLGMATAASALPALRAGRVDPTVALQTE